MANKAKTINRRQYPAEFQAEAVRLADSIGINAAADRLEVPRATVGNWARRRRKGAYPQDSGVSNAPGADGRGAVRRPAAELEDGECASTP